jgi:hypothetical protein
VKSFFWRWCRRLLSPFTTSDLRAGYVYELAFRQFEVSDTRVFARPAAGRAFFEGVIHDHLDLGRPASVSLLDTPPTPAGRPPTTYADSAANASSNASRTPTATSSPQPGAPSPCCSPKPTAASSPPASPSSTHAYHPN